MEPRAVSQELAADFLAVDRGDDGAGRCKDGGGRAVRVAGAVKKRYREKTKCQRARNGPCQTDISAIRGAYLAGFRYQTEKSLE